MHPPVSTLGGKGKKKIFAGKVVRSGVLVGKEGEIGEGGWWKEKKEKKAGGFVCFGGIFGWVGGGTQRGKKIEDSVKEGELEKGEKGE